jgi:glycosyltransferase involved in cell wall biosynthesis
MDSIARRDKRRSLGLQPDDFVIVSVSRLIQGKGHEFLLRAAAPVLARNGRARLLIVGEGNLRAGLQAQAAGLSIQDRVHFAGHQHKEGVAACLGISNLFCLFSDYENYSNAALEAMSCGLPVLASRVGGFPLQIEQGINGYLVDRGDVAGATMRIEALMASRDLCHKLSQGATRFAANFSWEATAARASGLYERIARVH